MSEWPQHVLQRTDLWPTFGVCRSTLVTEIGGVAALMHAIMHVFFPEHGHNSFLTGVTIVRASGERLIVSATLGGFLADEKTHNQISGTKGASGTKCCISCANVYNCVRDDALEPNCVSMKWLQLRPMRVLSTCERFRAEPDRVKWPRLRPMRGSSTGASVVEQRRIE